MVGDGELRDQVEEMIHNFDMDSSFLITGWVDKPTAYMKVMDVGCLLSRWEGFGLVLPEYMACGVPVIATNVDAIPNIITNGKNGVLIEEDNIEEIVKATEKLVFDKLKRIIVNNEIIITQTNYDAKRVIQETIHLYRRL